MLFTRDDLAEITREADDCARRAARLYLMAAKMSATIKRREAKERKPAPKPKRKKTRRAR